MVLQAQLHPVLRLNFKKTGKSLGWFLLLESAWCLQVIGPCSPRAHSWHLWETPCQKWRVTFTDCCTRPSPVLGTQWWLRWSQALPLIHWGRLDIKQCISKNKNKKNVFLCVSSLSLCFLWSFYSSVTSLHVSGFLFLFSFISLFIHSAFSDPFLGDTDLEIGNSLFSDPSSWWSAGWGFISSCARPEPHLSALRWLCPFRPIFNLKARKKTCSLISSFKDGMKLLIKKKTVQTYLYLWSVSKHFTHVN